MKKLSKTQYNEYLKPPQEGEIIEGEVIKRELSALFLDLGSFGTGIIYGKEFYEAKEEIKDLKIGDKVKAKIISLGNEEGFVELSLKKAETATAWRNLEEKKEKGEVLKIKILGANKGGLLTKISGISGFLPTSQLSAEHYPKVKEADKTKILRELQKFIGQELNVKILDVSRKEEKLILSEKATKTEEKRKLLENYKVGDVVQGEITGLADFGAFIRFHQGKLEGLIHISELDSKIIENPSEVVKVGEKVEAKIISIEGSKVFLSLKGLKKSET